MTAAELKGLLSQFSDEDEIFIDAPVYSKYQPIASVTKTLSGVILLEVDE